MAKQKLFTVFEHQNLKVNQKVGDSTFEPVDLEAFRRYYGQNGVPYYSLIHNGIRFNKHVGVIRIGNTTVEVLPKADKNDRRGYTYWRDVLVNMLFASGITNIKSPGSSSLQLKNNSILDLYFDLFIRETEYLLHNGLTRKYRRKEQNTTALKGSLQFSKHLRHNLCHKERFYVNFTTYDTEHLLHCILYTTIGLLKQINTNSSLHGRIGALTLNFPEMPPIRVQENTFARICYDRKTSHYKNAIEIARLLLLHYHPDVKQGKEDVLSLMFDMNILWEQFIFKTIRKYMHKEVTVTAQSKRNFWCPASGNHSTVRPDIVINKDKPGCVVLDTKWKDIGSARPSVEDLRQMYVYHAYYHANRVALVYPGSQTQTLQGNFIDPSTHEPNEKQCGIITISVEKQISQWQQNICKHIRHWMREPVEI